MKDAKPDIFLDDIRACAESIPPAAGFAEKLERIFNLMIKSSAAMLSFMNGSEVYIPPIESISWIICEELPYYKRIVLSGRDSTVITYDPLSHSYRKAAYNIAERQIVPTEQLFDLTGYRPSQVLEELTLMTEYPSDFAETALRVFKGPVVEVIPRSRKTYILRTYLG